jgi:ABC-type branched-subunit amino acid transport system ATPase component/sugar phosphate permease
VVDLQATRDAAHLKKVHEAEAVIDDITETRARLREEARKTLGVHGEGEGKPPKLRALLKENQVSAYPLSALGLLTIVDNLQGHAFRVMTPEISQAMGIGAGALALVLALVTLPLVFAPLGIAALVQRHPRRALLTIIAAAGWAVATLYTGFVTSLALLALVLIVDGLTTASVGVLHPPLLMDSYPAAARVRILSAYNACNVAGNLFGPLFVALLAGALGFTWRGVFLVMGIVCIVVVPYTLRLRDPGFGKWDTQLLRDRVHEETGTDLAEEDVALGFFEITRRVLMVPTIKALLVGFTVFGMLLIPYTTFLSFYLDEDLNLGPGARGVFFAASSAGSIVALAFYGSRGEALFRRSPRLVVRNAALLLSLGILIICTAILVSWVPLTIALFLVAGAIISLMGPALGIVVMSVVPSHMRPHLAALQGIFLAGVGGIAGAILLGGMQSRYGTAGAIFSLAIPGVLGALLILRAGKHVQADLDRMIDEVLEDEQLRTLKAAGGHVPMLSCKGLDFSYGQLQVLFDVDFTVDDGEMVALLGTNGAGKSTLLKVISGIGLPQAGSVRYRGQDITYLDAERRTRLGITQVPGGRAVFGPLTVVENLRSYGYTLGLKKRELDGLIDECFEAFPRLHERRSSLAAQLSGGEQQMLGVSKALIMKPRLLIIDELSLGLAPVIVAQLLDMVRRINATGTAVVLVEQSVNIALSLVDHAYFMEKGEMRFDGAASDLLARDDLLRAVFLEGAGAAT